MPLFTTTILAAAPLEDALGLALVQLSPRAARLLAEETLDSYAPELLTAAASRLAGKRAIDELLLVAPSAWCAARDIGLTPKDWPAARAGVLESLEDLVPVPADDALVGLIGLFDEDERCTKGAVIAARASQLEPILDALRAAASSARETVIAAPMAATGLPIDREPLARVVEPSALGDTATTLRHALPTALDAPPQPGAASLRITEDTPLSKLAAAGALARRAAPHAFAPLKGKRAHHRTRFAIPAALTAAAILLLAAIPVIWNTRLEAAAENAETQRLALRADFDAAQSHRTAAQRHTALAAAFDSATSNWRSALPTLRDTAIALEDGAYLYRLTTDDNGVRLTGEAKDPGAILERLEAAPSLTAAKSTAPMTPSPTDPDYRVFTFAAQSHEQSQQQ